MLAASKFLGTFPPPIRHLPGNRRSIAIIGVPAFSVGCTIVASIGSVVGTSVPISLFSPNPMYGHCHIGVALASVITLVSL